MRYATREERPSESIEADPEQAQIMCKHGARFRCRECGTGERDAIHTTRGGQGRVARLARGG
jgi:hypothetical protein